jgi:propane monooxygenase coupling protein
VRVYAGEMLAEAGLPELCGLVDYASAPSPVVAVPAPPRAAAAPLPAAPAPRRSRVAPDPAPPDPEEPPSGGTYDFVGIVMAKSAEGDAVARLLARRTDVEVIEQPSFWDIRARDRLVIPYDEVSEELGYEIDAYSIQHEMSTHYGRMVATDESLMLFSDPTEAMEHLLS